MERFCFAPENANLIAENLIHHAADLAGGELARVISRLHKFIGAYPVSPLSAGCLEHLKRDLIELTEKVDEIESAYAPGQTLVAAE